MTSREEQMVVIARDESGKPTVWCDPEIAPLVRALNDAGIRTVASCSGHGHRPGQIALADGRELIIAANYEEARQVERHFPGINGEPPLIERLQARVAELEAGVRETHEILLEAPELNMGNFDADEVSALNEGAAQAYLRLDALLNKGDASCPK